MNEVFQKIVDTIVDAKGIDAASITPESNFKDLNVDSSPSSWKRASPPCRTW